MFAVPIFLIDILSVGELIRLGNTTVEIIKSIFITFLNLISAGALAAVVFEAAINHHLTPDVNELRRKMKWLLIGIALALIGAAFGLSFFLCIVIGLVSNMVMVLIFCPAVLWDVIWSATGFALWFAASELLFGWRVAGDAGRWLIGPEPLGLTFFGLPLERVLLIAGAGALVSPLFSAFKHRRLPHLPFGRKSRTPKIMVGSVIVLVFVAAAWWMDMEYIEPPHITAISPSSGVADVAAGTTITVRFSRPVHRDSLELIIDPEATGGWNFSEPAVGEHGFRQASYQTETTLLPGVEYSGRITGIRSSWGLAAPDAFFNFTTRDVPDIVRVTGVPMGGSDVIDIGMTPLDPCQPLTADLSAVSDDSSDWQFTFDPPLPATSALSGDKQSILVSGLGCFTTGSYHLRVDRRIVSRDTVTGEIVAASEYESVYETTVIFGASSATSDRTMVPSAPSVLGVTTSSIPVLQPVRQQKILNVKVDYQDQPLSCEAAALKMALAAQGVKVTETQIMKRVGYDPTQRKNGIWGDPNVAFVGNINGKQNTTGYGVHWAPIERAADTWRTATSFTNGSLTDLTKAIDANHAVVIWGTMGKSYRDAWKTPTRKTIQAWKGEHARTVIGYIGAADKPSRFIINDPIAGRLTWTAATLNANWASFNRAGVIIE